MSYIYVVIVIVLAAQKQFVQHHITKQHEPRIDGPTDRQTHTAHCNSNINEIAGDNFNMYDMLYICIMVAHTLFMCI